MSDQPEFYCQEQNYFDIYNLAYSFQNALALHGGLDNAPCLRPINAWVDAATNPEPAAPLTFQALI